MTGWPVAMHTDVTGVVDLQIAQDFYPIYRAAFYDINRRAAQRHMMTEAEFYEVMMDDAILKFVTRKAGGGVLGMSVMTNRLDHWPLLSPEFFETEFPEHYKEHRIWYVGFLFTVFGDDPRGMALSSVVYRRLISEMYPYVADSNGFTAMDFCLTNVQTRRLHEVTRKFLSSFDQRVEARRLDVQEFWAYDFGSWKQS